MKELAIKIDRVIQNAPTWNEGDPEPELIITEEFVLTFRKTP